MQKRSKIKDKTAGEENELGVTNIIYTELQTRQQVKKTSSVYPRSLNFHVYN